MEGEPEPWRECLVCGHMGARREMIDHCRGLGVFRVVSVVAQGRYACNSCHGILESRGGGWVCPRAPDQPAELMVDNLWAGELALEGFPGHDPDEFWSMLEKGGQVREGRTFRIAFEAM